MPTELLVTRDGLLATIARELVRDPRSQSAHTRRGYLHDLRQFETWRQGSTMTKTFVEEYAAQLLAAGRAPTGTDRMLAAVRWWARRLGDLAHKDPSLSTERRQDVIEQAARVAAG